MVIHDNGLPANEPGALAVVLDARLTMSEAFQSRVHRHQSGRGPEWGEGVDHVA